jgi:transcription elongation factor Elf1
LDNRKDFEFVYEDCFCGCAKYKVVSTTSRHRNQFNFVECADCGTIRINPYMNEASIDKYYKDVYGKVKRKSIEAEGLYAEQALISPKLEKALKPFLFDNAKILDFGGGAAGRLDVLRNKSYDLYICEADERYRNYANSQGIKTMSGDVKYDIIVLSHVLEHIGNLSSFLGYLKTLLSDKGIIYIEVPLIENVKKSYLLFDFHISHKYYFNALSFKKLLLTNDFTVKASGHNYLVVSSGKSDEVVTNEQIQAYLKDIRRAHKIKNVKMKLVMMLKNLAG